MGLLELGKAGGMFKVGFELVVRKEGLAEDLRGFQHKRSPHFSLNLLLRTTSKVRKQGGGERGKCGLMKEEGHWTGKGSSGYYILGYGVKPFWFANRGNGTDVD